MQRSRSGNGPLHSYNTCYIRYRRVRLSWRWHVSHTWLHRTISWRRLCQFVWNQNVSCWCWKAPCCQITDNHHLHDAVDVSFEAHPVHPPVTLRPVRSISTLVSITHPTSTWLIITHSHTLDRLVFAAGLAAAAQLIDSAIVVERAASFVSVSFNSLWHADPCQAFSSRTTIKSIRCGEYSITKKLRSHISTLTRHRQRSCTKSSVGVLYCIPR